MATHKMCGGCEKWKPFEEFYKKPRYYEKYGDTAGGFSHKCRECTKEDRAQYVKEKPEKCKLADKNAYLKRSYGIDLAQYNQMFTDQKGCCLGCERHQTELNRTLCVDHCHATGKVRGLLCQECNRVLGMVQENVKTLKNLINYKLNSESAGAIVIAEHEKVG